MRGKRGGACGCAGCPCESPPDESILPPPMVSPESNERAVGTSNSLRTFCAFDHADLLRVVRLAYTVEALLRPNNREETMRLVRKRIVQIAAGAALFFSGVAAGTRHARGGAAQIGSAQPSTVPHSVVLTVRDEVW